MLVSTQACTLLIDSQGYRFARNLFLLTLAEPQIRGQRFLQPYGSRKRGKDNSVATRPLTRMVHQPRQSGSTFFWWASPLYSDVVCVCCHEAVASKPESIQPRPLNIDFGEFVPPRKKKQKPKTYWLASFGLPLSQP